MKTFKFAVPCSYTYEIEAETEDEARDILYEKGGHEITGKLEIENNDYRFATLLEVNK